MQAIQRRLITLIILISTVLSVSLIFFIKGFVIFVLDVWVVFTILLLLLIVIVGFFIQEYDKYKSAKLIMENKIMNVHVAQIEQSMCGTGTDIIQVDSIECIISCFGILFGSKVIKFNIDGIILRKIEIGHDFICFIYGKDKTNKIIKLIHSVMKKEELQSITERFHYETGIIPIVIC